jgi:MATE family multidrug resistance protein
MTGMLRELPGLVRLAVPIVIGLAASTLLGVTDSIMLAPLGPVPLAAVGLTMAVAITVYAAGFGVLSALGVRIGAAHGARAGRRIPFLLRNGLVLGLAVGLGGAAAMALVWLVLPLLGQPAEVLAAMPAYYACLAGAMIPWALLTVFKVAFEAVGRPWTGVAFAFTGVAINIPLNYALIWGIGPLPMLGLTGAGVATLVAETLALAAAWSWWRLAPGTRRLRLRRGLDRAEILGAAREGAPLGALYVAETAAMAAGTAMIGTFGTVALAAGQVVQAVGGLLYMLPLGVAGAVALRVAQERGAGNAAAIRAIAHAALCVATVWLALVMAVLVVAGEAIAAAISPDAAVVALAAQMFVVLAVMQLMDGVQSTFLGALRGLSDTAWPALVSLIAYWGIALPAGWVLARGAGMGPAGIWAGFAAGLGIAAVALTLRFRARTA